MTQNTAIAYLKSVKSSPLKVRKVSKAVTGMKVSEALKFLQFSKLKISETIKALIYSAMSNAENNHNMDVDNLVVKDIDVGRAFALRRFHTRGRGKSSRILKTFSNIRVILTESEEEGETKKKSALKKAEAKKDTKKLAPKKEADKKVEKKESAKQEAPRSEASEDATTKKQNKGE
ncbi:MAG: 50S ribosomal protein L22 [Rickettsiales bacterium]|nr:50S ribosomal protein L22 [Rickettsiales bacterium]